MKYTPWLVALLIACYVGCGDQCCDDEVDDNYGVGTAVFRTYENEWLPLGDQQVTVSNAEVLSEGDFATVLKWTDAGDFDDDVGAEAVYDHSASAGTLTQTTANLAATGTYANCWATFTYTVSGYAKNGDNAATCRILEGFAAEDVTLNVGSNGAARTVRFLTAATPTDLVIRGDSDSAGDTFTLDDLSLKVNNLVLTIPTGTKLAKIQAYDVACRYTDDVLTSAGTNDPSTTVGMVIPAATTIDYFGDFSSIGIATTGNDAEVNVLYYGYSR